MSTITTRPFVYSENLRRQYEREVTRQAIINKTRAIDGPVTSDGILLQSLFTALAEPDPLIAATLLRDLAEECEVIAGGLEVKAEELYADVLQFNGPSEEDDEE